ncbi:MAG TPA: TIGR01459 family HAD-type hydrolase [Caulobacteraceae bacterium]|jgi:HAD superfamily hydrolase (TIGR01459 family)|nr:TIGR01459 family HAD-type hydrolase [Caulobacteraceae bacterium]
MTAPAIVSGLSEIADRYDVVLCDVWGVIHNGRESFPDACAALTTFQQKRGPVVLISNSPRPSSDVVHQLRGLKVPDGAWSGFVTSGDATREELARLAPGPAWGVGPARDGPLYEGTGVELCETPEEAAFVSCTGPFDDDKDTPEDYRERFEICVQRGLSMVCANPDRVVQRGNKLIYCAGALADLYEELGGAVAMCGKPFAPIYASTLAGAARLHGKPLDMARVLAIGDGIPTDVKGANNQGLDVLFVASGIHGKETADHEGRLDPERVEALLRLGEAHARWAMADLVW